jgi:hypothetical protein
MSTKLTCDAGLQQTPAVASGVLLAPKTLEELINQAAEVLPDWWEIRIEVQQGYGQAIVTRPDGTEVQMSDGENDIREQFRDALGLVRDELEADKLLGANDKLRDGATERRPYSQET